MMWAGKGLTSFNFRKSETLLKCVTACTIHPWSLNRISSPSSSQLTSADQANFQLQKCLQEHGIPSESSAHIVAGLPLGSMRTTQLEQNMTSWNALQFGQKRLADLLSAHPNLLLLDRNRIFDIYSFLLAMFNRDYVYKIMFNSPEVLNLTISEITKRLEYLEKQMMVRSSEIVNSSALSYPLEDLRTRFEFLTRCGVYKVVSNREDNRATSTNPPLMKIVDTDDSSFATKVAGLTLLEYEVFASLYKQEINDEEESEYDDE